MSEYQFLSPRAAAACLQEQAPHIVAQALIAALGTTSITAFCAQQKPSRGRETEQGTDAPRSRTYLRGTVQGLTDKARLTASMVCRFYIFLVIQCECDFLSIGIADAPRPERDNIQIWFSFAMVCPISSACLLSYTRAASLRMQV